jgi:hypothetical protein
MCFFYCAPLFACIVVCLVLMNNAHGAHERAFWSHCTVFVVIIAIAKKRPGLRFALVVGLRLEQRVKGGDKSFKHDQ